jgi:hypothetical protein
VAHDLLGVGRADGRRAGGQGGEPRRRP